jgi:hypothetical protein
MVLWFQSSEAAEAHADEFESLFTILESEMMLPNVNDDFLSVFLDGVREK